MKDPRLDKKRLSDLTLLQVCVLYYWYLLLVFPSGLLCEWYLPLTRNASASAERVWAPLTNCVVYYCHFVLLRYTTRACLLPYHWYLLYYCHFTTGHVLLPLYYYQSLFATIPLAFTIAAVLRACTTAALPQACTSAKIDIHTHAMLLYYWHILLPLSYCHVLLKPLYYKHVLLPLIDIYTHAHTWQASTISSEKSEAKARAAGGNVTGEGGGGRGGGIPKVSKAPTTMTVDKFLTTSFGFFFWDTCLVCVGCWLFVLLQMVCGAHSL